MRLKVCPNLENFRISIADRLLSVRQGETPLRTLLHELMKRPQRTRAVAIPH